MNTNELLFKFVKDQDSKYCYNEYLNESIGLNGNPVPQDKKDELLKQYIENFLKENRPAPKLFYLREKETRKILEYETRSNAGGDCCVPAEYVLTDNGESPWCLTDVDRVIYVKYVSTPWYNADYDTPHHDYKPEELEVVDEYGDVYDGKPISDYEYFTMHDVVYNSNEGKRILETYKGDPKTSYNHSVYECNDIKERYAFMTHLQEVVNNDNSL